VLTGSLYNLSSFACDSNFPQKKKRIYFTGRKVVRGQMVGKKERFKYYRSHQAPVAHTCNTSYSGGGDQEDHSSRLALGKQFERPDLEKTHHKKKGWRSVSSSKSICLASMRT
jgi:hypothetical protein